MATYTDEQLRQLLNLEADADVDAALRQLASGDGDGNGDQPADPNAPAPHQPVASPSPATPETPATPAAPETPAEGQPAEGATPQLVTLSAANHAELSELATWARTERRNRVLDDAVRSGRIAPAERTAFAAQLERDEAGTTTLLSNLAPRFAVTELGSAEADTASADTAADKAYDDFVARTFPELAPQA